MALPAPRVGVADMLLRPWEASRRQASAGEPQGGPKAREPHSGLDDRGTGWGKFTAHLLVHSRSSLAQFGGSHLPTLVSSLGVHAMQDLRSCQKFGPSAKHQARSWTTYYSVRYYIAVTGATVLCRGSQLAEFSCLAVKLNGRRQL